MMWHVLFGLFLIAVGLWTATLARDERFTGALVVMFAGCWLFAAGNVWLVLR